MPFLIDWKWQIFWLPSLDETYSHLDAVSLVIIREVGLHEVLTLVRHFEQEGFR